MKTVIQLFLLLTEMIPFPTSNTPLPTENDEYSMPMRFFGLPSFLVEPPPVNVLLNYRDTLDTFLTLKGPLKLSRKNEATSILNVTRGSLA